MKSINNEEKIVDAIANGTPSQRNAALKSLYKDPVIVHKIRELTQIYGNQKNDPKDILQEGIILTDELIRDGKFQGKSKVRTFLISVCKNILRSKVKKIDKIEMRADITDKEQKEIGTSPEEDIILVERTADQEKRNNLLQTLLQKITPNCQETLRLYYFESKNMAQVAETRGLKNANQAKKAMSRCREQLRKLILDEPQLAQFLKLSL